MHTTETIYWIGNVYKIISNATNIDNTIITVTTAADHFNAFANSDDRDVGSEIKNIFG